MPPLPTDAVFVIVDGEAFQRPRVRGDCLPGGCNAERPCPWAGCAYHLALDVDPKTGRVTERGEPESMGPTCALDVAEDPALTAAVSDAQRPLVVSDFENTLEAIGALLGVTRERIRQIEAKGLDRMVRGLAEYAPER